jgi:exodeoxyribonuclease VII large subunit
MQTESNNSQIYTISQLTSSIKNLLEEQLPFVWVTGEISNFSHPSSGHFYFTLKDTHAQINAIMFRGQNRQLHFRPENGMAVTGLGRITVYEPRGIYQIIFEYLEPKGVGDLQIAFEQLKSRLTDEGLFDTKYKKQIPFLPSHISLITSPTGAVVHDFLTILDQRFPNIPVEIIPVNVQGIDAPKAIAEAINLLNLRNISDVAVLARGGGSLEDLHAFNSEAVARAIFKSNIPIISAVGHETDFTIADFVADLRAPTPTAAVELAVPDKSELIERVNSNQHILYRSFKRSLENRWQLCDHINSRLKDPRKKYIEYQSMVNSLSERLHQNLQRYLQNKRRSIAFYEKQISIQRFKIKIDTLKEHVNSLTKNLLIFIKILIDKNKSKARTSIAKLDMLSPLHILARGYSITYSLPEHHILTRADLVKIGQQIEIVLTNGSLICQVERMVLNGEQKKF